MQERGILKGVVYPVVVIIVASSIAAFGSLMLSDTRRDSTTSEIVRTIEKLSAVDAQILVHLRKLELTSVRYDEKFVTLNIELAKLQNTVSSRYTDRDIDNEIAPLKSQLESLLTSRQEFNTLLVELNVSITLIERQIVDIESRLKEVEHNAIPN